MNKKEYVLNLRTRKIHRVNGCQKSRTMKAENIAEYYTIEEAKAEAATKYSFEVDFCGNCFIKEKKKMER